MFSFFKSKTHTAAFKLIFKNSKKLVHELKDLGISDENKHYSELEALILFHAITLKYFASKNIQYDTEQKLHYLIKDRFDKPNIESMLKENGFKDIDSFIQNRQKFYLEHADALPTYPIMPIDTNPESPVIMISYFLIWAPLTFSDFQFFYESDKDKFPIYFVPLTKLSPSYHPIFDKIIFYFSKEIESIL